MDKLLEFDETLNLSTHEQISSDGWNKFHALQQSFISLQEELLNSQRRISKLLLDAQRVLHLGEQPSKIKQPLKCMNAIKIQEKILKGKNRIKLLDPKDPCLRKPTNPKSLAEIMKKKKK